MSIAKNKNLRHPNIVFFLIDSLRSDLLLEYVGDNPNSFLSKILKQGTTFTDVISCAPYTIASETGIFTGFYPNVNGLDGWYKTLPYHLNKNIVTLTEVLKKYGYYNILIFPTNIRAYIPPYGFDIYQMQNKSYVPDIKDLTLFHKAPAAKFCFIDFERIHEMCVEAVGSYTKAQYLESLEHVNEDIERFHNEINFENTIFMMCSDHGFRVVDDIVSKEFEDERNSGKYLTDKTIKTFFSIIYPRKIPKDKIINKMLRSIDIMPTLLDLIGLPCNFCQGESMLPLIECDRYDSNMTAFSVTGQSATSPWKPDTWSIRTDEWKYVKRQIKAGLFNHLRHYEFHLFNMKDDPNETKNCIEDYPEIAADLDLELNKQLEQDSKTAINYYQKTNFPYKKYLKTRYYPFKIKLKVWLNTFFRYKLKHRLKFQVRKIRRFIKNTIKSFLYKN